MATTDVDVLYTALEWARAESKVVLATVVRTWGSAPRKAGSHMAIREDGVFVGSVSGGCVEGEVIQKAIDGFDGVGWNHLDSNLGNIVWPIEEASWLRLTYNKDILEKELNDFIQFVEKTKSYETSSTEIP